MTTQTKPFSLGREAGDDGRFQRQTSAFRRWVTADGSSGFPAEAGRYHLYVCLACPWASRSLIVRRLKGLEDVIGVSYVDPIRDERGWAFTGGPFVDDLNGFAFLAEAYARTDPSFAGRVSVPVLWDRESGQIVNNESGEVVRMLESAFDGVGGDPSVDLYPAGLREEIDALNEWIYHTVNDGVYRAGFSTSQDAYAEAYHELFATLDVLEERLDGRRYLLGDEPTEADWRLFVTLVRFDPVYYSHFKCNRRRILDYTNLWGYTRDLFQRPGIAELVDLDQIKRHYYGTHPMINPSGIVPLGPEIDLWAPHGREALAEPVGDR
jgi:putative glutathione S-transferase